MINPEFTFDDAGEIAQSRNIWDFKAARATLKAQNKVTDANDNSNRYSLFIDDDDDIDSIYND